MYLTPTHSVDCTLQRSWTNSVGWRGERLLAGKVSVGSHSHMNVFNAAKVRELRVWNIWHTRKGWRGNHLLVFLIYISLLPSLFLFNRQDKTFTFWLVWTLKFVDKKYHISKLPTVKWWHVLTYSIKELTSYDISLAKPKEIVYKILGSEYVISSV